MKRNLLLENLVNLTRDETGKRKMQQHKQNGFLTEDPA